MSGRRACHSWAAAFLWARTGGGGHGSLLGEGWRVTWHQDCLSEKKLGHNRNDGAPRCLLVQVDACVLAGAPTGFTGLQVGVLHTWRQCLGGMRVG